MPDMIEFAKSDFARLLNAATGKRSSWVVAADAAIARALERQELADAFGEHGQRVALEGSESALERLLDEYCGTPPRIPIWWPPHRDGDGLIDEIELAPHELLTVGARFQGAADTFAGHALAPVLAACADKFIEQGLARMEGIPRPEPAK